MRLLAFHKSTLQKMILLILVLFLLSAYKLHQLYNNSLESSQLVSKVINPSILYLTPVQGCSTIHLVFQVDNYDACNDLSTAIKSILVSRQAPLHLHLLVNKPTKVVIDTLFKTWQLPMVNFTLYMSGSKPLTSSELLYKLPSILAVSVQTIALLHTKIIVFGDIGHLWKYHSHMLSSDKVIGMVGHTDHSQKTPNIEHFDTSVILINLNLVRYHTKMSLALNSTYLQYLNENDLIYELPCNWNIYTTNKSNYEYCYNKDNDHALLQWTKTDADYQSFFGDSIEIIQQMDGYLLCHKSVRCGNKGTPVLRQTPPVVDRKKLCDFYKVESQQVYRTQIYFHWNEHVSQDKWDVTLLMQFSADRLMNFEQILKHWDGPISAAIYASDYEAWQVRQYMDMILGNRGNVAVHMVYRHGTMYPINYMRNVALERVQTPFVFLSDFDFVPMKGLYMYLKSAVTTMSGNRQAFVVPAYESLLYKFNFPKDKDALVKMVQKKQLNSFHLYQYAKGHAPTKFSTWESTDEAYDIEWSNEYEPYIVVRSNVTRYDERFVGYGWNKVSHIYELHMQGYRFTVLPKGFILHPPHPPSVARSKVWSRKEIRDCIQKIKAGFKKEMQQKYANKNQN